MAMHKLCGRCKCIIPYNGPSICEKCKPAQLQDATVATRQYNRNREKKYTRFYQSSAWQALKSKKLQDEKYRCEYCRDERRTLPNGDPILAEDVHHTKPIQTPEGWLSRFDISLLKCACIKCHNREHGRFGGGKKL